MSDENVREIEQEIERTRGRMAGNLEELTDRLDPSRIKERARENVVARVESASDRVVAFAVAYPEQVIAVGLGLLLALVLPRPRHRRLARQVRGGR
ncbi:MAG: DUF3618 domain-containing protein [Gemmatimonadales bacterium]|nr:DUF3618 domain-containing protein [Gemmatimonadales bacterium]